MFIPKTFRRSSSLLKIVDVCVNKKLIGCRIMPKRFLQAPPNKKLKISHKYTEMVKPSKVTESEEHNLSMDNGKTRDSKSEQVNDVLSDFSNIKVDYLESPVKSENDKKEYRVIRLPNGLTAMLIADPSPVSCQDDPSQEEAKDEDKNVKMSSEDEDEESGSEEDDDNEEDDDDEDNVSEADEDANEDGDDRAVKKTKREEKMAACGLCIGVGSFSDPPEVPGMAHFLEHMVFMGSKKYPQENDFDAFIKKHGGSDNAYTECEQTTFYFEIQEKFLHSALDRFAQFFISPLMKRDAITREREAVESEFQMALPSDFHRKEQLFSSLAKTEHPATKFVWGNLVTLRDNIEDDKLYEELHKFRERHYSAHRMTVAIQARLPLDTLEKYVKECFSNVPNNGLPATDFNKFKGAESFDTPRFRRIYKVKPIKDVCQVELTWTMPSLHHLYKSKPHQYVSWIIGHEGKGSLISYLRKKMWCLDISSGNGESGFEHSSMYALFSLSLVLTDEGHKHLREVLDAVYSYINLVRREGPQKRIYDEIHKIEETNFRFADETPPDEYVEDLCEHMHFYAPAHYINGSDLYFEYDPVSIKSCMDMLIPENANIIIFDKKFNEDEFDKIEPWFKTKYADIEIPLDWINDWKSIVPLADFHLPEPNIFVTDDFTLIPKPMETQQYPVKIHSDSLSEVWYKADTKFGLPECYMNFYYVSPLPLASPENSAMLDLFVTILKQLLIEELYPASAAELNHHIMSGERGLVVKVNGFNQKLPLLLTTITKYIANFSSLVTEDLFDVMKKEQLKSYYNTFLKPGKLVKDVRLSILMLVHWTTIDKHTVISGIQFEQMRNFAKHFTDHIYTQCLIQGNMTEADSIANARKCVEILNCGPLLESTIPKHRVMQIPIGVRCCSVKNFNPTDSNSNVTNYYQSGGTSIRLAVLIELIIMIMEEPLFNQLRTQEQLGYNVFCLVRDTFGILGYSISVCGQADKYTNEHIDQRIEEFLTTFKKIMKEMSDKDLQTVKEALSKLKQCADMNLKEEVDKNWAEITSCEYIFDRLAREVDAIDGIKIEELRKWMNEHTMEGSNLRKLSVQIVGCDGREKEKSENNAVKNDEDAESNLKKSKKDSTPDHGGKMDYSLQYLLDQTNEKTKKPTDYYITNIEDFKRDLYVFPVYKSTS